MTTDPLLPRTRLLLNKTDLPLTEVARQSGVGYEWLRKFAADDIPNPGVTHVQRLHDFLAKQQVA